MRRRCHALIRSPLLVMFPGSRRTPVPGRFGGAAAWLTNCFTRSQAASHGRRPDPKAAWPMESRSAACTALSFIREPNSGSAALPG
ncbi:MAG: hypothetical protein LBP22_06340 [Deltaproteobacteria bacterium]|nr:hypothetical protein [Deltaproteobacteria bacterium]